MATKKEKLMSLLEKIAPEKAALSYLSQNVKVVKELSEKIDLLNKTTAENKTEMPDSFNIDNLGEIKIPEQREVQKVTLAERVKIEKPEWYKPAVNKEVQRVKIEVDQNYIGKLFSQFFETFTAILSTVMIKAVEALAKVTLTVTMHSDDNKVVKKMVIVDQRGKIVDFKGLMGGMSTPMVTGGGRGIIDTSLLAKETTLQKIAGEYAKKITAPDANTTYIAIAPIGSLQSAAVWQVKKIVVSGTDTVVTWAGGGAFNQVATNLAGLIYA